MKSLIALCAFFVPFVASALIAGPFMIKGQVRSLDEKAIEVTNDVAVMRIPREFVAEKKIKIGQTIEILLSSDQIEKVTRVAATPEKKNRK